MKTVGVIAVDVQGDFTTWEKRMHSLSRVRMRHSLKSSGKPLRL